MPTFLSMQRMMVLLLVGGLLSVLYAGIPADAGYWTEFWWLFPISLLIALVVNVAGISGAALFVPFFVLIFPLFAYSLDPVESVMIGLITESFGLTSSTLAFYAFGLIDRRVAGIALLGALPFVLGGAFMTALLPHTALLLMIAILLVLAVTLLWYEKALIARRRHEHKQTRIDIRHPRGVEVSKESRDGTMYHYSRTKAGYVKRFFAYGLGGFFQGAAGFGIGELGIISMIMTRIPTRIAIGTSHLVIAGAAIAASVVHLLVDGGVSEVPWNIIFMTAPAAALGGQVAPYVAARVPTKWLERGISVLFLLIAGGLILLAASSR